MKNVMRLVLSAMLLTVASGCGITDPKPLLDEFTWEGVEDFTGRTEGVDIQGFLGDIAFAGQVKTPTLCYSASSKFESNGNTLTVRVTLTSTNSPTCTQGNVGFTYSGAVKNLSKGTYTFRVIQQIGNETPIEITEEVTL